jgi:23S rRNA pseudouridine2605 synthase
VAVSGEKRRRAPRKKPAPAAHAAPDDAPAAATEALLATPVPQPERSTDADLPAGSGVPESGAEDGAAQAAQGVPNAAGSPRRQRNRRRGRRGGDGPRAAEAGEMAQTDGAADRPERPSNRRPAEERLSLPQPEVGEVLASVISGAFDAEPAGAGEPGAPAAEQPAKRVLAPEPDAPKLHKVLAQSGIGSRRDMEQLVQEGRITVNGQPAHVGQRISFGDQLRIDGRPIKVRIAPPPPRVLAYHKPAGEVVTHDDPQHRPTVFRRLPRLAQGKWQSVGRLDINTEGLLLFTNSGELANQLMHPRFGVEREYAVRVLGVVDDAERERLLQGIDIDGQSAAFKSIEDAGGEGANRWYRVVITEGRNREVRKLFEAVGHAVSRLIRVRYGSVVLPRGLRRGVWVDLEDSDVRALRQMARPQGRPGGAADGGDDARAARSEGEQRGRRGGRRSRQGERRADGVERAPRAESGEGGPIPNPLQQTFDKRAFQQDRARRAEYSEDGPIPNPLQQTFDKRALQQERARRNEYGEDGPIPNPLQQTYDKRFVQKSQGLNLGRGAKRKPAVPGQPDPMQTAVGYIGADAFVRKAAGRQGRGGRGKPGRGGRGR